MLTHCWTQASSGHAAREGTNPDPSSFGSQARKFAKAMKAPLVFTSATHSINVQKLFKVVLAKVFDLKCTLEKVSLGRGRQQVPPLTRPRHPTADRGHWRASPDLLKKNNLCARVRRGPLSRVCVSKLS